MYLTAFSAVVFALTFVAWRRYLRAATEEPLGEVDACPYSLTDVFGDDYLISASHQEGIQWLTEVFSRSARKFPDFTALQIPHTGESLTFAQLDAHAERIAAAVAPFLTGPDQVVALAMSQDSWHIVAAHLGVLKAGGTLMFLDVSLPDALVAHMLDDARPVVVLTRGQADYRSVATVDVLALPDSAPPREPPAWLDDPAQRLAAIFYTSGTTGRPKGVECPHAGYVNLALSYADYFDLIPGMDATSLTSSLGYDGSISEMYSAWVSGCAVVMLTPDQVRSGPDLIAILRDAEVTVLFCPPVLLTTLTATPEVDLPYPLCRYVVPAGEAFPSALVEPWTRGRRQIINTYGPTEASTDTSRQSLRPGETVTIGSPFANVMYVILEVDQLTPLPHGAVGELCIGGVHLARGYRNLPELTAQKFITHPQFGRLYRTGDKCRIDPRSQRVEFIGRTDTQLKVRGHRVEPHAVEDILQSQFSEIETAVLDYQNGALVAFVVAPTVSSEEVSRVAPAPAEWAARVTARLAQQLPAPAVPTRIVLVDTFTMKPVSGKIDRKQLPDLRRVSHSTVPEAADGGPAEPTSGQRDVDESITSSDADPAISPEDQDVLEICRTVLGTALGLDDDFTAAGGHSIAIAHLAQRLQSAGWGVTVRDLLTEVNTPRRVGQCPRRLQPVAEIPQLPKSLHACSTTSDEPGAQLLSVGHFTIRQVLFACLFYSPAVVILIGGFRAVEVGTFFATASLGEFIIWAIVLYVVGVDLPFAILLWVMLLKRCMGGHVRKNNVTPGVYPKWSKMHLRIWCIGRMENTVLLSMRTMYRSAPLMAFVLRQLGATVGRNLQCAHNAHLSGPLDLLTIGDSVAIQTGAYVQTAMWAGQHICVGPVRLESECKIGMRAAVSSHVTVGRGAWITPFSPIHSDVESQEMWEGAPARCVGRVTRLKRTAHLGRYTLPIWVLETLNILMQTVLFVVLRVVPAAAIFSVARELLPVGDAEIGSAYFDVTPLFDVVWQLAIYGFLTTWASIVVTSLLVCLFIRWTATVPGLYPARGLSGAVLMCRMNMLNSIQNWWTWTIMGQYLRALAGVRFPRVGGSECDLMFNLVPELASADSQVFWSHGCFTNMLDYGAEYFTLRSLNMPRNFFSSNNCVAEYGQFPTSFLLGVSTPGSDIQFRRQMWSRQSEPITVAGNPPVRFASTLPEGHEAGSLPHFPLFLTRVVLNDLLSIGILRIADGLIFTMAYLCMVRLGVYWVAGVAGAVVLTEVSLVLSCAALKKCVVGDDWGSDHTTPFWSWKHFAYFFAQDCFFAWCRRPLGMCAGTILSNPILRLMGCQIGRRTIVNQPMQCSDWNAVSFGDDCVMDGVLQLHTFENMILRVKRTHVQDGCSVACGATVMGGAVIEKNSTIMPLSLVLKEMKLFTATYEGSPAGPVSGSCAPKGHCAK